MNIRSLGLIACLAILIGLAFSQGETSFDVVSTADTSVVLGTATVADAGNGGVAVRLEIGPNDVITPGEHAIHLHENGSCEAADSDGDATAEPGGAAGGHYNPTEVGHGDDNGPHVGDSDDYNYTFGEDGSFSSEIIFSRATMTGASPVLTEDGTALVIHAGTDDMVTDPSGNAGERVACGVIAAGG